jgi:hypothetical protein
MPGKHIKSVKIFRGQPLPLPAKMSRELSQGRES